MPLFTRGDPDSELDLAPADTDDGGRGLIGKFLWTLVLPVRLAGGVVGVAVLAVVGVVRAVMLVVKLATALVAKVIQLVSDLVYGVWRLLFGIVKAVLALVMLLVGLVTAIVGGAVKLVWGILTAPFRALGWLFGMGRLSGARKARKQAEKEAAGDAVVELED